MSKKRSNSGITNSQPEPELAPEPIEYERINNAREFSDNKSVDEYFRGSTYSSNLGSAARSRGYGITEDINKPATKWEKSLTFAQSQSVSNYTGDSYEQINNYLRGIWTKEDAEENYTSNSTLSKDIKNLDNAIKKFNLKESITVYRTCENDVLDKLKVGTVFHDDGYGSTSMLPTPVASGNVHLKIKVPKGKGVGAYVDGLSWKEGQEFEFLLGRGADYVVERRYTQNGKTYIEATVKGFSK